MVVRAKIEVNPTTAALTVTTNTAAQGNAIPTIIEGIPLQIKHVNVNITRPGFTFNPTNCNPTKITGTVASAEGARLRRRSRSRSTNAAVWNSTRHSRSPRRGRRAKPAVRRLTAKVTDPTGRWAPGEYRLRQSRTARAAAVTVDDVAEGLYGAQFEANPAGCPAPSVIGTRG